jgi:hypothetical protein
MNSSPSFIIFGVLENLLWISKEFTSLWVFSKWLNQICLNLKPQLRFFTWIQNLAQLIQFPSLNGFQQDSNLIWILNWKSIWKPNGKNIKATINSCSRRPKVHRGLRSLGPTRWPSQTAFGAAHTIGHSQSAHNARPVHTGLRWPRLDARLRAALISSSGTETWNRWWEDGLGSSATAPLHHNLLKQTGKGVLTRVKVGLVVVLSIKEGNGGERCQGWCPAATQASGRLKELMWTLDRRWAARWEGTHHQWQVAVAWSNVEDEVGVIPQFWNRRTKASIRVL